MDRDEAEIDAATDTLAEALRDMGFPAKKAAGMARWLASFDEEFEDY